MPFGQLVIGPPGSGKSTYCYGVAQYLRAIDRRLCIVNLDPANDDLPYTADVDITGLVSLDAVQEQMGLGPNGGLAYCMDFIKKNIDWLQEHLQPHLGANKYLIIDCPGQAELYMCHDSFRAIVKVLTDDWHINLTAVQLVDSHLCTSPHKYLAALLMTLTSMLQLEMPYVNVLTKVDLLEQMQDEEHVDVDQLMDIEFLQHQLSMDPSAFQSRFSGLTTGLCEVVQDYGLVSLTPLSIQQPKRMQAVLTQVDLANGYSMSGLQGRNPYAVPDTKAVDQLKDASVAEHQIWTHTADPI